MDQLPRELIQLIIQDNLEETKSLYEVNKKYNKIYRKQLKKCRIDGLKMNIYDICDLQQCGFCEIFVLRVENSYITSG